MITDKLLAAAKDKRPAKDYDLKATLDSYVVTTLTPRKLAILLSRDARVRDAKRRSTR